MKDDKDVVFTALKNPSSTPEFWGTLKLASKRLKNDIEIVSCAVKIYPDSLQYAGDNLKSNADVVYIAAKKDFKVLRFADPILKNNNKLKVLFKKYLKWNSDID